MAACPQQRLELPATLCSTHPADPGHQVLAELLAGVLTRAAWEVSAGGALLEEERRHDPAVPALPAPMIPFNADDMPGMCAMLVSSANAFGLIPPGGKAACLARPCSLLLVQSLTALAQASLLWRKPSLLMALRAGHAVPWGMQAAWFCCA